MSDGVVGCSAMYVLYCLSMAYAEVCWGGSAWNRSCANFNRRILS